MPKINIPGLSALAVFYVVILLVGILAAWLKTRKKSQDENTKAADNVMVAGRDLGLFVGLFTMTATWVGGGYINGTAEAVFSQGLLHAQAPIGNSLSLFIGGLLFARKMREKEYLTMLDPFQERYGSRIGGLLYVPALLGELFWSASILVALGSSVSVIMDIDLWISVIVSACIAVGYTFFGGLYSVAYTDVVQLICVTFGLTLCIPFAWKTSPHVCWEPQSAAVTTNTSILQNGSCPDSACFEVLYNYTLCNETAGVNLTKIYNSNWVGTVPRDSIGQYLDVYLLLIFGGIPWQVYFQRVLAVDKPWKATVLSMGGAAGCLILSIPPALIGLIGRHTDWDGTGYGRHTLETNPLLVLPAVVQYLTPTAISFFGLGAISAAVMSSSDSSVLSASSMFAHNIYTVIFRPKASDKEILWILRVSILACGVLATSIALVVKSVYSLWTLSSDLVYVILFPQLLAVIYIPWVNSYGVLSGYFLGLLIRLLGGEVTLHLPAVIPFGSNVPFRTVAMALNFTTTLLVSWLARHLCGTGGKLDFLNEFGPEKSELTDKKLEPTEEKIDLEEVSKPAILDPTKERRHRHGRKHRHHRHHHKEKGHLGEGTANPSFETDAV